MAETRHDALWRRVEAHLDARTDPFQDAALARELRAVPDAGRAARRLLARLGALQALDESPVVAGEREVTAASNVHPAPRPGRARSRPVRRFVALAACVAAAVSIVVLVHDDDAARRRSRSAGSAIADPSALAHAPRPELGVVYSASIEVERSVPPPPRAALVVHESRQVVEWSLEGNPR